MNRGAVLLRRFFQSQLEVAPRLGVEPWMLSLLLAGRRKPSIETAAAIQREFDVPMIAWTEDVTNATADPEPTADPVPGPPPAQAARAS
jgi:transcriptional regulator with XRE-family HTH domain